MYYKNNYFCMSMKVRKGSFLSFALVVTAIALTYCFFIQHDNLITWIRAERSVYRQRRQIERYVREIAGAEERIKALSTDTDSLERYARERFRFAEPGDDVYVIPEE